MLGDNFAQVGAMIHLVAKTPTAKARVDSMVRKVGLALKGTDLIAEVEDEAKRLLTSFLLDSSEGKHPKALGAGPRAGGRGLQAARC